MLSSSVYNSLAVRIQFTGSFWRQFELVFLVPPPFFSWAFCRFSGSDQRGGSIFFGWFPRIHERRRRGFGCMIRQAWQSGRLGCMIPGLSLALLNKRRVFLGAIYCFLWLYVRFSVVPGGGWFHISASKRAGQAVPVAWVPRGWRHGPAVPIFPAWRGNLGNLFRHRARGIRQHENSLHPIMNERKIISSRRPAPWLFLGVIRGISAAVPIFPAASRGMVRLAPHPWQKKDVQRVPFVLMALQAPALAGLQGARDCWYKISCLAVVFKPLFGLFDLF